MYQDAKQSLFTVRDYLRWSASRFIEADLYFGHGTDNAWDEAVALVSQVLHLPEGVDALILDAALTLAEKNHLLDALAQRIDQRRPTPYITGRAWFAGLSFIVDERVLIPRSPIAELILQGFSPWLSSPPSRILDMCCGSACIGIALAQTFYDAQVDCSDISDDALAVAQANIELHACGDRVRLLKSDIWQAFEAGDVYDLMVVNPPYVDQFDYDTMPPEYGHEPRLALTSGDDGLDFTKQFLAHAVDHLSDDGLLVLEVGNSGEALEQQFPTMPLTWHEFAQGGVGVLVMTRAEAKAAQKLVC